MIIFILRFIKLQGSYDSLKLALNLLINIPELFEKI